MGDGWDGTMTPQELEAFSRVMAAIPLLAPLPDIQQPHLRLQATWQTLCSDGIATIPEDLRAERLLVYRGGPQRDAIHQPIEEYASATREMMDRGDRLSELDEETNTLIADLGRILTRHDTPLIAWNGTGAHQLLLSESQHRALRSNLVHGSLADGVALLHNLRNDLESRCDSAMRVTAQHREPGAPLYLVGMFQDEPFAYTVTRTPTGLSPTMDATVPAHASVYLVDAIPRSCRSRDALARLLLPRYRKAYQEANAR